MSNFLLRHKLDQIAVFRRKAGGGKVSLRKAGKAIME